MNTTIKTILIFYHSPCRDGFAAAWVANKFFKETTSDLIKALVKIRYFGADPSRPKETIFNVLDSVLKSYPNDDITVYLLDISLGIEAYQALSQNDRIDEFYIIDHHTTGFKSMTTVYPENNLPPEYIFDLKESGCSLAWKHFFLNKEMPKTLAYIKDRDLWKWTLPNSQEVSEGLFLMMPNNNFDKWDAWFSDEAKNLAKAEEFGKFLFEQTNRYLPQKKRDGKIIEYNGHRVFVINSTNLNSEIGSYVCKQKEEDGSYFCDYAFIWRYSYEANAYYISLRSSNERDIDVSIIAQSFSPEGGGHVCAAGCTLSTLPKFIYGGISGGVSPPP